MTSDKYELIIFSDAVKTVYVNNTKLYTFWITMSLEISFHINTLQFFSVRMFLIECLIFSTFVRLLTGYCDDYLRI